jgi:hypothetical protein
VRPRARAGLALLLCAAAGACSGPGRALRGYADAEPEGLELLAEGAPFARAPVELRGQVRFLYEDFGSLSTDGLSSFSSPWKLVSAALVRERHVRTGAALHAGTLEDVLAEYGFVRPRRIANWQGDPPRMRLPMGFVVGTARRGFPSVDVEIANLGCATCHGGPLYGADGRRTDEAWLGLPNPSLDLSRYAADVFVALRAQLEQPDSLLAAVRAVYPETPERELETLRKHLIPGARAQLAERAERFGGLLPFENGGPGLSNGVGSLRFLFGLLTENGRDREVAYVSAPELSGTTLRRTLLVDGVYTAPGREREGSMRREDVTAAHMDELAAITSLFVVGTQGVTSKQARDAIPAVEEIMRFIDTLEPPRYPGLVDSTLALRGEPLYRQECAACHGTFSPGIVRPVLVEFPNRLSSQREIGTDSIRWATADPVSLATIPAQGWGELIDGRNTGGYLAPDLSGLWATAPYLHNGSVPTLWHLLTPAERPRRFWVGGHEVDYQKMGIAGTLDADSVYGPRAGYVPWARPRLYDTTEPGRSNAGHAFGDLSEDEKRALIEYLRLL